MADGQVVNARNTEYNKVITDIIKKNKELSDSLKITRKELQEQNKAFDTLSKTMKTYFNQMQQMNRNMGGRVYSNPNTSQSRQRLATNFINNYSTQQSRTNVINNTGSGLNTQRGQQNFLSIAQGTVSSFRAGASIGNQGLQGILSNPGALKALTGAAGAVAIVGLLVTLFVKMTKAGGEAYKTQLNMAQSVRKLGDGSKYATQYAKELNEELGVSMSRTLASLSSFSQTLQSQGFSSAYAGKFSVEVSKMAKLYSDKMGTSFTDTQQQFIEAMNGSEQAMVDLFGVGNSAFTGWLAQVKGINRAMVELSPGRLKQEYKEFFEYLTSGMNGLGSGVTSTAKRIEAMMNQLADIGEKLKVIFLPLFEAIVSGVSAVVDFIFDAINGIRDFIGMKPLVLDVKTPEKFDSGIEKQIQNWTKLGEQIDAAKGKLYSFDEVESQQGLLQVDEEMDEAGLGEQGLDMSGEFDMGVNIEDRQLNDFLNKIKSLNPDFADIKLSVDDPEGVKSFLDTLNNDQIVQVFLEANEEEAQYIADLLEPQRIIDVLLNSTTDEQFNEIINKLDNENLLRVMCATQTDAEWSAIWSKLSKEQKLGILAQISNPEEWQTIWNQLTTTEKMSQEGLVMAFSAIKSGDAWGLIESLVFGNGARFLGLEKIQYFFGTTLTNLIFSVGQAITSKLEEIFPKFDGLTEKLTRIKEIVLDFFSGVHEFKVNFITSATEGIGNFVNSVGDYFNRDKRFISYDNGGIAIKPHVAQIGTQKGEVAIPLGSSAAESFYNSMASQIAGKIPSQQAQPASQDTYNINLGKDGYFFGSRAEFMKLTEMIADNLQQLQKQRGSLNYGTI